MVRVTALASRDVNDFTIQALESNESGIRANETIPSAVPPVKVAPIIGRPRARPVASTTKHAITAVSAPSPAPSRYPASATPAQTGPRNAPTNVSPRIR